VEGQKVLRTVRHGVASAGKRSIAANYSRAGVLKKKKKKKNERAECRRCPGGVLTWCAERSPPGAPIAVSETGLTSSRCLFAWAGPARSRGIRKEQSIAR